MLRLFFDFLQEMHGTITANPKWNAKSAAATLDKAMDGMGTDEKAIINVLCSCNSGQRTELKKSFKAKTKEDLLAVVREELSGDFLEMTLVMLRDPLAFDIDLINTFLKVQNFIHKFLGGSRLLFLLPLL